MHSPRFRMKSSAYLHVSARSRWLFIITVACLCLLFLSLSRLKWVRIPSAGEVQGPKKECRPSSEMILDWNGCFTALDLASARHTVDLSGNGFHEQLPKGFLEWAGNSIHTLYLSDNGFEHIPDLSSLSSVRMLSLRRNKLKELDCDALPPNIYHLIVTDNEITSFKGNCNERLRNLNKLMMARNKLDRFPEELRLPKVELIRLPQNRLKLLPRDLLRTASKLKWASFAENPCCPEPSSSLPFVKDFECEGAKELGSGTSGVALQCVGSKLVFKRFKPNSSDGSSDAELKISALLPKNHKTILAPLYTATLARQKDAYGVVFPFKDAMPIGLPPQFGSDDRFPPQKQHRFTAKRVLNAVREAACGLSDMHNSGVAHMDLYAHNTLLSETEMVFLDFGAATCIKFLNVEDARLIKVLDVRAFGNLVGNLMDFVVSDSATDAESMSLLRSIKQKADAGPDSQILCQYVQAA